MNRAERRRLGREITKESGVEVKTVPVEAVTGAYDKIKRESIKQAVDLYSVSLMTVLHDKYGFGRKRLLRISDEVTEVMNSIGEGYVSLDDLKQVLLEECKIEM